MVKLKVELLFHETSACVFVEVIVQQCLSRSYYKSIGSSDVE